MLPRQELFTSHAHSSGGHEAPLPLKGNVLPIVSEVVGSYSG